VRVGIFGGTFDPIHMAHLVMAEQCRDQGRLDEVRFVIAARPPHKPEPVTPFAQRVEMLALAISGQPAFRVEKMERDRPGPSYTADTLEELSRREPGAELVLIVGSDSLRDMPLWYQPVRVVQLAELLVVARPDCPLVPAEELRALLHVDASVALRMEVVESPLLAIASRDLRRRLREGRSVRYMLPRAVEAYIADKGLYRNPG
jgi:nicotinate-nucleotide adenylyltransferase